MLCKNFSQGELNIHEAKTNYAISSFSENVHFQRPQKANYEEMTKYHSDDYIKFLRSIRPDNMSDYNKQMQRCE